MIKKVLITGASGFIGSYIIKEKKKKNIDFINISNVINNCKYPDKTVLLSLSDKDGLIRAINDFKPDAVLHLAAIASPTHKNSIEIYDVNVCGTENLLDAIRKTCTNGVRVILFSTAGVYGNQNREFLKETDVICPVNHYSSSKAVMEFMSHNYNDCMDIRVVRPFNIIGPGQSLNFIVPKLVNAFKTRQPEVELGNLSAIRDFISVKFCACAVIEFLLFESAEYRIINICSGVGNTVQEISDVLSRITGFLPKVKVSDDIVRHNEIWRLVGSTKRIDKIMKSQKSPDLESILIQMINE
jgi:nucleoside-diphosphate-sugar epimerase